MCGLIPSGAIIVFCVVQMVRNEIQYHQKYKKIQES